MTGALDAVTLAIHREHCAALPLDPDVCSGVCHHLAERVMVERIVRDHAARLREVAQ